MTERKTDEPRALEIMSIDMSSRHIDFYKEKASISNDKNVSDRTITEKCRELSNAPKHIRTNSIRDLTRKITALLDDKISDNDTADLVTRFPEWGKKDFAEFLRFLKRLEKHGVAAEGDQDKQQIQDLANPFVGLKVEFLPEAKQDKKPNMPVISEEVLQDLLRKAEVEQQRSAQAKHANRRTGTETTTIADCAALATLCFVIGASWLWLPVADALTSRRTPVFSASVAFLVIAAFTLLSRLNTGQAKDTTHVWVMKGSKAKVRDATVADAYEQTHGYGSWHRKVMETRRKVRNFGTVVAITLPVVLVVTGAVDGFEKVKPLPLLEVVVASLTSCLLSRLSFAYVFSELDKNERLRAFSTDYFTGSWR